MSNTRQSKTSNSTSKQTKAMLKHTLHEAELALIDDAIMIFSFLLKIGKVNETKIAKLIEDNRGLMKLSEITAVTCNTVDKGDFKSLKLEKLMNEFIASTNIPKDELLGSGKRFANAIKTKIEGRLQEDSSHTTTAYLGSQTIKSTSQSRLITPSNNENVIHNHISSSTLIDTVVNVSTALPLSQDQLANTHHIIDESDIQLTISEYNPSVDPKIIRDSLHDLIKQLQCALHPLSVHGTARNVSAANLTQLVILSAEMLPTRTNDNWIPHHWPLTKTPKQILDAREMSIESIDIKDLECSFPITLKGIVQLKNFNFRLQIKDPRQFNNTKQSTNGKDLPSAIMKYELALGKCDGIYSISQLLAKGNFQSLFILTLSYSSELLRDNVLRILQYRNSYREDVKSRQGGGEGIDRDEIRWCIHDENLDRWNQHTNNDQYGNKEDYDHDAMMSVGTSDSEDDANVNAMRVMATDIRPNLATRTDSPCYNIQTPPSDEDIDIVMGSPYQLDNAHSYIDYLHNSTYSNSNPIGLSDGTVPVVGEVKINKHRDMSSVPLSMRQADNAFQFFPSPIAYYISMGLFAAYLDRIEYETNAMRGANKAATVSDSTEPVVGDYVKLMDNMQCDIFTRSQLTLSTLNMIKASIQPVDITGYNKRLETLLDKECDWLGALLIDTVISPVSTIEQAIERNRQRLLTGYMWPMYFDNITYNNLLECILHNKTMKALKTSWSKIFVYYRPVIDERPQLGLFKPDLEKPAVEPKRKSSKKNTNRGNREEEEKEKKKAEEEKKKQYDAWLEVACIEMIEYYGSMLRDSTAETMIMREGDSVSMPYYTDMTVTGNEEVSSEYVDTVVDTHCLSNSSKRVSHCLNTHVVSTSNDDDDDEATIQHKGNNKKGRPKGKKMVANEVIVKRPRGRPVGSKGKHPKKKQVPMAKGRKGKA